MLICFLYWDDISFMYVPKEDQKVLRLMRGHGHPMQLLATYTHIIRLN